MMKTKHFGYLSSYGRNTLPGRLFSTYLPDYNRFLKNKDYIEAFKLIEPFAKAGDCVAERCLGKLYLKAPVKEKKFKSLTDFEEKLNAEDIIEHIKARMKENNDEMFAFKRNVKKELSAVDPNNFYGSHFEGMKWLHKSAKKSDVKAQLLFSKQVVLETHRFSKSHFKDAVNFLESLSISKTKYHNEAIYLLGILSYDGCKQFHCEQNKTFALNLFSLSKQYSKSKLMISHMILSNEVKQTHGERMRAIYDLIKLALKETEEGLAKVYAYHFITDTVLNFLKKDDHEPKEQEKHFNDVQGLTKCLESLGHKMEENGLYHTNYFDSLVRQLIETAIGYDYEPKVPEACLIKAKMLADYSKSRSIQNSGWEESDKIVVYITILKLYERIIAAGYSQGYLEKYESTKITCPEVDAEKFICFEKAADLGSLEAYKLISDMYLKGQGVPKCEETSKAILSFVEEIKSESIV